MAEQPQADPREEELEPETEAPGLDPELLARREAALAHVLKFGDPVLKSKASPVSHFDRELAAEIDRMLAIMRDGMGVGLAATQLGILRRLLVFQAGHDAQPSAVINPEIDWASQEIAIAEEGCLSIPRISVDVERPLHIRLSGVDPAGDEVLIEASGLEARVLQHEVDHLDGVLMLDRTTREQRKGAMRAIREGLEYSPPTLEPEDAGAPTPA